MGADSLACRFAGLCQSQLVMQRHKPLLKKDLRQQTRSNGHLGDATSTRGRLPGEKLQSRAEGPIMYDSRPSCALAHETPIGLRLPFPGIEEHPTMTPHVLSRIGRAAALFVASGVLVTTGWAGEAEKASLIGKDLSAFAGDTGDWRVVGKVKMDPADNRRLATSPGTGVALNGPKGRTRNLLTKLQHGDVEAHIEFMVPKGSNSGVYFQGRYEVQILDSWGVKKPKYGDCGGIYQRWKDGKGFEGRPPRVNASRPPGEWQTFDCLFRAPRFDAQGKKIANAKFVKIAHNGIVVHENVEVTGPTRAAALSDEKATGPLMLQGDHGPVAYRNIWLRPLKPAD